MDVNIKVFKKDENKDFRWVRNVTMGEADFNQVMRSRNQPAEAAEKNGREENLSPVLILRMSSDMDQQIKLAHRVVHVVYRH